MRRWILYAILFAGPLFTVGSGDIGTATCVAGEAVLDFSKNQRGMAHLIGIRVSSIGSSADNGRRLAETASGHDGSSERATIWYYSQNPSVGSKSREGEATLVNPVTSEIHVLNEVGSFIWNYISRPRTKEDIVTAITRHYQITPQEASRDAEEFLAQMQAKGLVVTRQRRTPIIPLNQPWIAMVTLTIIVLCIAKRKDPIGGFFLYYLATLPIGLFWGAVFMLPVENPYALAGDTKRYVWSLGLVIPFVALRLIETMVILRGSMPEARGWIVIRRVKGVLWLQVLVAGVNIVIHAICLPVFIVFDLIGLLHVAVWLPYLSRSKRIARVFAKA